MDHKCHKSKARQQHEYKSRFQELDAILANTLNEIGQMLDKAEKEFQPGLLGESDPFPG